MAKVAHKPILGFGPIGWIALVILTALALLALVRDDVQYDYIALIYAGFGESAADRYMVWFHHWHGLAIGYFDFNLLTMIPVIIALYIHPTQAGWCRYVVVAGWALFKPLYMVWRPAFEYTDDWLLELFPMFSVLTRAFATEAILGLSTALVMLIVTRSWRVAGAVAALILAPAIVRIAFDTGGKAPPEHLFIAIVVTWQLAFAAILLTWAIRARISYQETGCPKCGYDLRSDPHAGCPECGWGRGES